MELDTIFKAIYKADKKPAILKIAPPYSKQFVPLLCQSELPSPLSELYTQENLNLNFLALTQECEKVFKSIKVFTK